MSSLTVRFPSGPPHFHPSALVVGPNPSIPSNLSAHTCVFLACRHLSPTLSSPSTHLSAESLLSDPSGTFLGHSRTGTRVIFGLTVFSVTELLGSFVKPQLLNKVLGGKNILSGFWLLLSG